MNNRRRLRIILTLTVVVTCLTALAIAVLNIKRVAIPPALSIQRRWKNHFPADGVTLPNIQQSAVNISVPDTHFENAFIPFEETIIWGADNPSVKQAQLLNVTLEDVPTLVLEIEAETGEQGVYTIFEFVLSEPLNVTDDTVIVAIAKTLGTADLARIEVGGSDRDGKEMRSTAISLPMNEPYFVYTIQFQTRESLKDFGSISQLFVVYYCQPDSSINAQTHVRVLNIFDHRPSLEGYPLEWGRHLLYKEDITFPHRVPWTVLKPSKIFLEETLHELMATWSVSYNTMRYTWLVQNAESVLGIQTNAVIWFDQVNDAPIIAATMSTPEGTPPDEIDILEEVENVMSNSSRYVRYIQPIPTDSARVDITISYDFWPSPWRETALVSCIILIVLAGLLLGLTR